MRVCMCQEKPDQQRMVIRKTNIDKAMNDLILKGILVIVLGCSWRCLNVHRLWRGSGS